MGISASLSRISPSMLPISIPNRDLWEFQLTRKAAAGKKAKFQSLIGIYGNFSRRGLKGLIYVVFEVRLRQPVNKVPFQASGCQGVIFINWFKLSADKGFRFCGNLNSR